MKWLLFLALLSTNVFSFEFQKGIYEGQKMGPFTFGDKVSTCQIEVLDVFKDDGLLIKYKGKVDFLKKKITDSTNTEEYNYDSLNLVRQTFSLEKTPAMSIFDYTDGPAFRAANEISDCAVMKLIGKK